MTKAFKERLTIATESGLSVKDIRNGKSTHKKVRLVYKGDVKTFTVQTSETDTRGMLNWRTDLRKWMRSIDERK